MITTSGRNIPDPPTDPEERRQWKEKYHASLYGASPETIHKIAMRGINQTESRIIRYTARPFPWRTYMVAFVIILIALLVVLFIR